VIRVIPPRNAEALANLHATPEYQSHPYFEARRTADLRQKRHDRVLSLLFPEGIPATGSVLDVGCDTGDFLAAAKAAGLEAFGVEVSEHSARVARRRGIDVAVGDVLTLDLAAAPFDAITLIDVIEHVASPLALLRGLVPLLKPGGRIYINTPNPDALIFSAGNLLHALIGDRARWVLDKLYVPYHEHYFPEASLKRLVGEAGLSGRHYQRYEFPLSDFGHGLVLKAAIVPIFFMQAALSRQSIHEIVSIRQQ
jgi:2-polyprenyl-3-methyl-5-hydroxy-6-metoxy-1,4-benzoquinol methylase